ncbi:MAG: hypothetical protein GVY26_10720 [Bacteroidetes bacterium]|jgi:hypothetical protein|nr:hypothetical protein [Bacteroidota bacterium]
MFNLQKDQLFTLVKSLTKAEKRSFRLYVNRLQSSAKFIQLFDVLDKMEAYDEEEALRRLPGVKKRHLANLKRHLYKQILTSLRLIHIQKSIDIEIREQIDFARILYGKGMYMQALRILESTKRKAVDHHQDILHLEIIEFQKLIEARHITRSRSVQNKMEALLEEAEERSYIAHSSNLFSNFNIQMHGWYIQYGHIKSEAEREQVQAYFRRHLPAEQLDRPLTFFEKVNLYQAYFWHRYILLDFRGALDYARQWVALFQANAQMMEKDPVLFMRGQYYLLVLLYLLRDTATYGEELRCFESFVEEVREGLNENGELIAIVYLNLSRLNYAFISGQYQQGVALIPEINAELKRLSADTDVHRILLFYFKFAYLHFLMGQCEQALHYLNEIIHLKAGHLRDDLLHNARVLHLLCHYELGNYHLLEYLIPSVRRLFDKATDLSPMLSQTVDFLAQLSALPLSERPAATRTFQRALAQSSASEYEKKAVNYLDLPAWLEAKLAPKAKSTGL